MYAAGISSASLFSNECTQVFQPLTATESHYSHVHSFVQPLGPNLYRTVYFPSHFLHISRCIVHFAFFLEENICSVQTNSTRSVHSARKRPKKGNRPCALQHRGDRRGISLGVRRNHVQKPGLRLPCFCDSYYRQELRQLFEGVMNNL